MTIFADRVLEENFLGFGMEWEYEGDRPDNNVDNLVWTNHWPEIVRRVDFMRPSILRVMHDARMYTRMEQGRIVADYESPRMQVPYRILDYAKSRDIPVVFGEWWLPQYAFTCKKMLCVTPDSRVLSREDAKTFVSGLNASLRTVSPSGVVVGEWELTNEAFSRTWRVDLEQAGPFPAFRFSPVPPGEYTIQLNVQQPAAALVEIPHRVVAKHELCGIERLPALFSGAISVTYFVIGGAVAAVALWPRKAKVAAAEQPADTH